MLDLIPFLDLKWGTSWIVEHHAVWTLKPKYACCLIIRPWQAFFAHEVSTPKVWLKARDWQELSMSVPSLSPNFKHIFLHSKQKTKKPEPDMSKEGNKTFFL
jgi:hypothetical protein